MKSFLISVFGGLLVLCACVNAHAESEPVLIFLAHHGAPDDMEFVPTETIKLLESRIPHDTDNNQVVVWFENGTPSDLDSDVKMSREYLIKSAKSARLDPTSTLSSYIMPNGDPLALQPIDESLKKIFDKAHKSDEFFNSLGLKATNGIVHAVLEWFKKERPNLKVQMKAEIPAYESWRMLIKANLCEAVSMTMLADGEARGVIQMQFMSVAYLNQHAKLRDIALARLIHEHIQEEGDALHIVIRGNAHWALAKSLADMEVRSENIRVVPLENEPLIVQYFERFDPSPGDLKNKPERSMELKVGIIRIIVYDLVKAFRRKAGEKIDDMALTRTIQGLSAKDLWVWIQIVKNSRGVEIFQKTDEWLRAKGAPNPRVIVAEDAIPLKIKEFEEKRLKHGDHSAEVFTVRQELGKLHTVMEPGKAAVYFDDNVEILEKLHGKSSVPVFDQLVLVAISYGRAEMVRESEAAFDRAEAMIKDNPAISDKRIDFLKKVRTMNKNDAQRKSE